MQSMMHALALLQQHIAVHSIDKKQSVAERTVSARFLLE